jgi:hypothetical protein
MKGGHRLMIYTTKSAVFLSILPILRDLSRDPSGLVMLMM